MMVAGGRQNVEATVVTLEISGQSVSMSMVAHVVSGGWSGIEEPGGFAVLGREWRSNRSYNRSVGHGHGFLRLF